MPDHAIGPLVGLVKPPRRRDGIRMRTDPGTKIVNRIVFRMGVSARVIGRTTAGRKTAGTTLL
jgi:hypothetical protein